MSLGLPSDNTCTIGGRKWRPISGCSSNLPYLWYLSWPLLFYSVFQVNEIDTLLRGEYLTSVITPVLVQCDADLLAGIRFYGRQRNQTFSFFLAKLPEMLSIQKNFHTAWLECLVWQVRGRWANTTLHYGQIYPRLARHKQYYTDYLTSTVERSEGGSWGIRLVGRWRSDAFWQQSQSCLETHRYNRSC